MTASAARYRVLEQIYDLLSNYLVDECPDDEHWENFDPEIDDLRTVASDLLGAEAVSLAAAPTEPTIFSVEIEFLSGQERFASETYRVEAYDWSQAKRLAFDLASGSAYNDEERIPDLARRAIDRTILELAQPCDEAVQSEASTRPDPDAHAARAVSS
ncbi:hypothetical protein [Novosphingobium sp.]|uniref:hypothetical protein n=1 Tax=Novosphingobium sp. TaxID=1874826 RepID=UPI002FDED259